MPTANELIAKRLKAVFDTNHLPGPVCSNCIGSGGKNGKPCKSCKGTGRPNADADTEHKDKASAHRRRVDQEVRDIVTNECAKAQQTILDAKSHEEIDAALYSLRGYEHVIFDDGPHPDLSFIRDMAHALKNPAPEVAAEESENPESSSESEEQDSEGDEGDTNDRDNKDDIAELVVDSLPDGSEDLADYTPEPTRDETIHASPSLAEDAAASIDIVPALSVTTIDSATDDKAVLVAHEEPIGSDLEVEPGLHPDVETKD